ncbi:hypothetical protein U9M48_001734 [Paspalum notatum var. saurae]|uniref:Uncharacterized protein n=1 Tax=Paspalum notatum var. saurae TaxID=547442 RepID=A0AAQ3PMI0_PASNO
MSEIPSASAIGYMMYAMIYTRLDIFFALSVTSRYQSCPVEAVKNILKYLRRTKNMFLVFGGEEELVVKGYTDTDSKLDSYSVSMMERLVGRIPSKIRKFVSDFGVVLSASCPFDLYCDNICAIA